MADWRTTVNKWLFDMAITRAFAKWYLDLIKNALVVSALVYTWKKTDDAIVGAVATLTFAVFLSYIVSYPLTVFDMTRPYIRSLSPLRSLLLQILSAIVFGVVVFATFMATMEVMSAIFRAQGAIK
ncbi:MAG TPA: hypothetical protein VFE60_15510 [Roseiarcus sp.]|jgi:hypothetical protein|nr:hypothetical protein [Roseiarcus sp.]